jgi:hypothetical protein
METDRGLGRKFCLDCKHCSVPSGLTPVEYMCNHIETRTVVGLRVDCDFARRRGPCGMSGALFESREEDERNASRWFRKLRV